eukprot:4726087-Pyramimonas_sp.AAC.1
MTTILDAYHPCWMQFGPAKVLYSDGEDALNHDTAKAVLKAKGTELRIRARGQHATTIEARNGIIRHLLHVVEAELNRLLHEALFAADAFTFYDEAFPCSALSGRQPAMLPDLPVLDHEQLTETSGHSREQTIRRHYYDEGDLVDYHRPTTTNDDWGGWNGPFPVVRNDPERGQ